MNDALKILGTLLVAGFLTLALTNTSVADVASSARQNVALQNTSNSIYATNTNDFVAVNDMNTDTTRFMAMNTNDSVQNRIIDNSGIYKDGVVVKTNTLRINDGIYATNTSGYLDNQRVINHDAQNVVSNQVITPVQNTVIGTASAANSGVNFGKGFGLWLLFFGLLAFAIFMYRVTTQKRNRLDYAGYEYAPAFAPRYYENPAIHAGYQQNPAPYQDPYYGYADQSYAQVPTETPLEKKDSEDVPEYRINLGN